VARPLPFHFTTELPLTNPVPVTVRVKAAPPAVPLAGASNVIVGAGLFARLMVNARFPDVPPPGVGLNTVTCAVPAAMISAAVIAAFSCVALTNVVVRLVPFQFTTELPLTNPLPFTVKVKAAPPGVALVGASVVIVGAGFPGPVTTPPVPRSVMMLPPGETATVLVSPMGVLVTPEAMVRFTTPTVPLAMIAAFRPSARQVYVPAPEAQVNVLPALVAAVPAIAEMETTLLGGYVKVHCRAAGWLPAGDVRVRLRETVPLAAAVPDDSCRESVCAEPGRNERTKRIARKSARRPI